MTSCYAPETDRAVARPASSGAGRYLLMAAFDPLRTLSGASKNTAMGRRLVIGTLAVALTASPLSAQRYLASIAGVPLNTDEAISAFSLKTWGVRIWAICRIPSDWEVTGGSFGPSGKIAGQAGHGAAFLRTDGLGSLNAVALVELSGPVQRQDKGAVPATFGGTVSIHVGRGDTTRTVRLSHANVRLAKAASCPTAR